MPPQTTIRAGTFIFHGALVHMQEAARLSRWLLLSLQIRKGLTPDHTLQRCDKNMLITH